MMILTSPTKTMVHLENPSLHSTCLIQPSSRLFVDPSIRVMQALKALSAEARAELWGASKAVCASAEAAINGFSFADAKTPAFLAFSGLQYRQLSLDRYTDQNWQNLQGVHIISAVYGLLRPLDLVMPYRLDLKDHLMVDHQRILDFWRPYLNQVLARALEDQSVLDLCSQEYAAVFSPALWSHPKVHHVRFGKVVQGRFRAVATLSKMGRGQILDAIALKGIDDVLDIKNHPPKGMIFASAWSDAKTTTFVLD